MVDPLGRSQLDNFETEDSLHTDIAVDLHDTDVLYVHTAGSPMNGKFYKVIGKGEARIGRANYNHVRIRLLDVVPPGLSGMTLPT